MINTDKLLDLAHRLYCRARAYPESVFRPLSGVDLAAVQSGPVSMDRISAEMGRSMAPLTLEAAAAIELLLRGYAELLDQHSVARQQNEYMLATIRRLYEDVRTQQQGGEQVTIGVRP